MGCFLQLPVPSCKCWVGGLSFLVNPGSRRVSSWLWLKRLEQLQGHPCPRCPSTGSGASGDRLSQGSWEARRSANQVTEGPTRHLCNFV